MTCSPSWCPKMPDAPALELADLVGGYQDSEVVHEVSVTVPRGSVVVLLGPNGAGKTTSLRLASGLLRPRSGRILMDGIDVTRMSPHARAELGLCHIPEGRAIFPSLTVRENILLHAPRGSERRILDAAVDAFPAMRAKLRARASTLSGGQQQMLALVPAFVTSPSVVLVDEPSLGLAPVLVDAIFELLGRLAARGVAMLVVEQYVKRALAMADTAYVLNRGRVELSGSPSQLAGSSLLASYLGGGQPV
jgi:branched-chain amino acid transport system ATP-binding protein